MIVFDRVSLRFNDKTVVKDFSLTVREGDKIVFSGKSGIGKSTLFRLILGFVQPEEGKIYFNGRELDAGAVWELRRRVAYVSQDLDIGEGTVRELTDQAFRYKANAKIAPDSEEISGLLSFFELGDDVLDEHFSNLSGGEKQRIAIILAVLLRRDIFLLDEAASALDGALKKKVVEFFTHNNEWTVLIISHDAQWASDRVRLVRLEAQ